METTDKTIITVNATVNATLEKVWQCWTLPQHITQWNNASDDWHTPTAENDLQVGGKFVYRMEAKDCSFGFDFTGVYNSIRTNEYIEYTIEEGRKVEISFLPKANETIIVESFEAEDINPIELQKAGWQAILDNFKKYVETN